MKTDLFIMKSRGYLPAFEKECVPNCKYEPKGITNIEGFYWWAAVGMFNPDIILESGISKGRSTHILGMAQKYYGIPSHFAFDKSGEHEQYVREKIKGLNTNYKVRDSAEAFEKVLAKNPDARVVAVVDGPKSGEPFRRVIQAALSFKNLCCILVHDCSKESSIPANLESVHKESGSSHRLLFTDSDTNCGLQHLNDGIMDELHSTFKEMNKMEKLALMQCVGIIYNPRMLP